MRKRILSLFLCFVLLISSVPVQVFAAGEYLSDWEFTEGTLVTGDNTVAMVAGAEYTLIEFYPEETGIYTFEGPAGSKLANFNASYFPNNITGDAAADSLEWTCSSVGQSLLLGICAQGDAVTVSVARTGDHVSNEIQYTVYENTHTPDAANKDYCAKASGKLTPADTLVKKGDRYYTENGEAVFVNFTYTNLSISAMLGTSPARYVEKDADGNVVVAYDYYDALSAYSAMGTYPLTTDLEQMLRHLDIAKRWTEDSWLNGWQELCFLVNDHVGGEAVVENGMANTYCTSCGKLLKSEEAVVKVPHAFGTQALAEGSNTVSLNSGAVYTLNKFKPAQTGVYTFQVPAGSKVANYNTSFNPMDLTGDAASTTLEWTCSSVGQHILVGVSGSGESVNVTITRTGDYVSNEIQYENYVNLHTPSKENTDYCENVGGWMSVPSVVPQGDFFYGVTVEGEYIPMFVDFAYSELSLTSMLETSSAKYAKLDENGNVVEAYNYYDALKAYTAFGKYPLTQDLMQMLQHLDAAKGWTENGWLRGWQELCFLASEHEAGEPVIEGNLAKYYCTGCNKLLKTEEAPEEECKHPDLKHVEAVSATCMNEGNIEHWYCEACETVWLDQALTQVTDKAAVVIPVDMEAHIWDMGEIVMEPTCSTPGEKRYICQVCGLEDIVKVYGGEHVDEDEDEVCDLCDENLANLPGSMGNPEILPLNELREVTVSSYSDYYLQLTVPEEGILTMDVAVFSTMMSAHSSGLNPNKSDSADKGYSTPQCPYEDTVSWEVAKGETVTIVFSATSGGGEGTIRVSFEEKALPQGSNVHPFVVTDQEESTKATAEYSVTVPAGQKLHFDASNVQGSVLKGTAVEGLRYLTGVYSWDADENGIVSIIMDWDRSAFELENTTDADLTAQMVFEFEDGHKNNPLPLELGTNDLQLLVYDKQGKYLTWTAPADGSFTFHIAGANGYELWQYQITSELRSDPVRTAEDVPLVDNTVWEVQAGQALMIHVIGYAYAPDLVIGFPGVFRLTASFEEECRHPDLTHVEAVPPTCMAEGSMEYWHCEACGIFWKDQELTQTIESVILPVADHDLVHVEAVEATCMNEGNIEHWYCNVCEVVWQDEALTQITNHKNVIVPVAQHDLVHVEAVEATCMAEGNIEHWYCNVCEVVWQDEALTQITNHKNVILPVADHDLVHVEAKEPTATEDGNIEHWYCNVCEVVWQDEALTQVTNHKNVIIPALGQPELPGNTAEEYILVEFTMNEDWTAGTATVTVEPGIWYYGAYISGMDLTANGEAVEVTPAQPRMPVIFCFTNEGTEAVTYELAASYPVGTMSNPAVLAMGENAAPIEEGNDQGYFFTWTAQVPGTLTVTMPQGNWFYTLSNLTAGIYGDMQYSNSDPVVAAPQLEVNAGDQIQLIVNNFDPANPWTIPGGTLTFQASFEEANLAPLALVPMIDAPAEVVKQDDGSYIVYLDKEDVAQLPPFSIMAQTLEPITKKDLKWTVSDSRIATVKSDAYSPIGNVTLKKGADGACVITAQNVKTKDVASVTIVIRSYEPRLESASLSLNSNAHAGAVVALTESYGNTISSVTVHEYDAKAKTYAEEASQRLVAEYDAGILYVTHTQPMKKGTYKLLLKASCANGETYEYPVSLKVTETLPSVTVKQLNKFNTFYTDSEAQFLITAKDAAIAGAELFFGENPAFQGEFDPETGILTVRYSESYLNGETKLGVKGDIMVFCEGYWIPVEKATTISTEKKAPKVWLDPAASVINTALVSDPSVTIRAFYGDLGNMTTLEDIVKVDAGTFAQAEVIHYEDDDQAHIKLTLTGKKGGTAKIYVQAENWTEPVVVSHKITVKTAKPALKFEKKGLTLNNVLTDLGDAMEISTDQGNVTIESIDIQPVSKKESVLEEMAKIQLDYSEEFVSVRIDPENAPKKGTYEYKVTATVGEDVTITKNFKVAVEDKVPAVKLKSSTLKLNKELGEVAYAETPVTVTGGNYAYRLVDLVSEKEYDQFALHYDAETGILRASLEDAAANNGKTKVNLYPVLESYSGEQVTLSKALTLTVQIYSGKPSVTLKATGKLDTIVPGSAMAFAITKLTNIAGVPEAVRLEGETAELFNAELTENGARVTLKPDVIYRKDQTHKLQLVFTICGLEVSANVNLKVTQSSVKLTAPKAVNYYQSQSGRMAVRLVLTAPAGATIGDITLGSQTAKQLLGALGEEAITWTQLPDGTYLVSIQIADPGHLVYGKSYNLFLDVTPQGNAENAKPTSLKVAVKVAK